MDKAEIKSSFVNNEDIIKYFSPNLHNNNLINPFTDIQNALHQITKASENLKNGQFREAKLIYDTILSRVNSIQNPNYDIVKQLCHHHVSNIYSYNKNWNEAKERLEIAFNLCKVPEDKMFLNKMLGEALFGCKEYIKAQKIFKELIDARYDVLNCKVWLVKSLYNEDLKKYGSICLEILENEVLKTDPQNIEGLIYISDLAIKMGIGKFVVDHLGMALGIQNGLKINISKESLETGVNNFCDLMKDEENLKFFDKFKDEMSVYKFLAQKLKEKGMVETVIKLHIKALSFTKVLDNPREIISLTLNIISHYEILNQSQKGFDFYLNFLKNYSDISVGSLKNNNLFNLLSVIKDIYSEEHRKEFIEMPIKFDNDQDVKDNSLTPYSELEIELLCIHLQIFKMLFVSGALSFLPKFANLINPIKKGRALHETIIKNQNSYFSMCSSLLHFIKFEPYTEKIYICGDSHSLVPSWHVINGKLIVPKLVTGLKCWHLRKKSKFFTRLNFDKVIESIPVKSTVIFILGEIDCREGIIGSVEKCRYPNIEEATKFTGEIYLNTLKTLKDDRQFKPIIHPVCPVIDITRSFVLCFNEFLKRQNTIDYMDFSDLLLVNEGKELNKKYVLDGTHLSPTYVNLLEPFI